MTGTPILRQPLTQREIEVLKVIAAGNTAKEAARVLGGIVPRTVEYHLGMIKRKLGLRNRADLVRYACAERVIFVEIEQAVNRHRLAFLNEWVQEAEKTVYLAPPNLNNLYGGQKYSD